MKFDAEAGVVRIVFAVRVVSSDGYVRLVSDPPALSRSSVWGVGGWAGAAVAVRRRLGNGPDVALGSRMPAGTHATRRAGSVLQPPSNFISLILTSHFFFLGFTFFSPAVEQLRIRFSHVHFPTANPDIPSALTMDPANPHSSPPHR